MATEQELWEEVFDYVGINPLPSWIESLQRFYKIEYREIEDIERIKKDAATSNDAGECTDSSNAV